MNVWLLISSNVRAQSPAGNSISRYPVKGSLIVVRMISKDIDHGNPAICSPRDRPQRPLRQKRKKSQQPEADWAIVSGKCFLWINDITVCECGSSCSSFLRHAHQRSQVVNPPAGVPCSCWYSPTQTKDLASGSGVSDLLMVRSGARLSSEQPTPPPGAKLPCQTIFCLQF